MLDTNWSLTALYPSFQDASFQSDFSRLQKYLEEIEEWTEKNLKTTDNALYKIEYFIQFQNTVGFLTERLTDFSFLSLSTDARNEEALKNLDKIESLSSDFTRSDTAFQKWLCSLEALPASPLIEEHRFYLEELIKNGKYLLTEQEEVILSKMETTGSMSWSKLQEEAVSTLIVTISLDGEEKKLPLSEVRNLAYDKSKAVRKKAYEAELKSYGKIASASAFALNSIKGEVITTAKLRGYASPLAMTLLHSRMDKKTLDTMFEAINCSKSMFEAYFLKKAELLGHKSGLPFYDLFAPIGKDDMYYTYEEACDFIVKHFSSFSEELGNYAKGAMEKAWIDVYPKEGKRGGAFCSNLPSIGESRILTNFNGSFNDVITIAHELGHGYHGFCLDNKSYLNSDYPMPIAETASTFCETLVKQAALKDAPEDVKLFILESDIADNAQVIIDILSRFLFEDSVFQKRSEGYLSEKELCGIMLDAQREAYGKGLDENYLHPCMWICKSHYYDAHYNYYNFPYAFGLLLAKGLYGLYEERGAEFAPAYREFLSATGSKSLYDVAQTMGIDLHDMGFWNKSLLQIKNDIDLFIKHCK